jgi:uncharacterized membrane protein YedE/YeeE
MTAHYLTALGGGALIGLAAALLLFANGRIAGVSGILGGIVGGDPTRSWRIAFLAGLALAGAVLARLLPERFDFAAAPSWPVLLGAGLLVGVGTQLGRGCTSGHGVCGLGSGSVRSLWATFTFMVVAALVVFAVRHLA